MWSGLPHLATCHFAIGNHVVINALPTDSVFVAKSATSSFFNTNSNPKNLEYPQRDEFDTESVSVTPTPDSYPPAALVIKTGRAYAVPAEVIEEAYPEAYPEPKPKPVLFPESAEPEIETEVPVEVPIADDSRGVSPSRKHKKKKKIPQPSFD